MAFDEANLQRLLAGTNADIARAFELIDRDLRCPLGKWLRQHFPALSPEDLLDVWSDTLLAALESVLQQRFNPTHSVLAWLQCVAFRRAIDLFRRETSRDQMLHDLVGVLCQRDQSLNGQTSGEPELHELHEQTNQAIATLPPRQRLVWEVFVAGFPETLDMNILARGVAARTYSDETAIRTSVISALREGRGKVQNILCAKGYARCT